VKEREYRLLEAISEDETITQAGLATRLGFAVGSVNWYIKRLISRGYLKATRMDRTRLRYNLTSEGMAAFSKNARMYMKDSLQVYRDLREAAKNTVAKLKARGVSEVHLDGKDEMMDIMRLTCIEEGVELSDSRAHWVISPDGNRFKVKQMKDGR